jgi:hypothetical protein
VTSITSVENKFQGDDGRFVTFLVKAENQRGEPVANYRQTFAWPESRS